MKILYLTGEDGPVAGILHALYKDEVICTSKAASDSEISWAGFIVSYGHRHILPPGVCAIFDGRAINLHIGFLPWNRGAHPNVWSAIEGTPSGVSLHYIDAGIDTGDIVAQKAVEFGPDNTLAESYEQLQDEAERLFAAHWSSLRDGSAPRRKQAAGGSFHLAKELPTLQNGWNTTRGSLRKDVCESL